MHFRFFVTLVLLGTLVGCNSLPNLIAKPTLKSTLSSCNLQSSEQVVLTKNDGYSVLTISGNEDILSRISDKDLSCLLNGIHVPEQILQKIEQTPTGTLPQAESFENMTIAWGRLEGFGYNFSIIEVDEPAEK